MKSDWESVIGQDRWGKLGMFEASERGDASPFSLEI